AGNAVLDAVNVQAALGKFDLLPLQVADLRGSQAVPVGNQDHGRVAMPIPAMLAGAVHQPVDLALGEVVPLDCQGYDAWCAFLGCRFHADKFCLRGTDCLAYTLFLDSYKGRIGRIKRIGIAMQMETLGRACAAWGWRARRPPGRGDFSVSNFHPDPIPGNLV